MSSDPLQPEPPRSAPFFGRMPVLVWGIALLAAVLHLAPTWRAQLATPDGWAFTGNLHASPDFMQYRIWMHQPAAVLLPNRLTLEPNPPHVPAVYYSAVGAVGRALGVSPVLVFEYAGSAFAFLLVLLLFATVRHFTQRTGGTWWVFLVALFGGGLGAPLMMAETAAKSPTRWFASPETGPTWVFFEECRGSYLIGTLFDSHFLLMWLLSLAAVVAFYFALRRPSPGRVAGAAVLFAVVSLVHLHEAVLLTLIAAAVLVLCWRKRVLTGRAAAAAVLCLVPAWAVLGVLLAVYSSSGLPVSPWRAHHISAALLFAAYPVGWVVLAWGFRDYWDRAGLPECFLIGWLLGCTGLTLSGPFYAFGDRGIMTLLVPLYLIAGACYFAGGRRVPVLAAVVLAPILFTTAVQELRFQWRRSGFDPTASHKFLSPDHRAIADALAARATPDDALLAEQKDLLWLATSHPGKFYSSHFFLTVDFTRKNARIAQFFRDPPAERAAFLTRERIGFAYAPAGKAADALAATPGVVVVVANGAGTLVELPQGLQDRRAGGP